MKTYPHHPFVSLVRHPSAHGIFCDNLYDWFRRHLCSGFPKQTLLRTHVDQTGAVNALAWSASEPESRKNNARPSTIVSSGARVLIVTTMNCCPVLVLSSKSDTSWHQCPSPRVRMRSRETIDLPSSACGPPISALTSGPDADNSTTRFGATFETSVLCQSRHRG